MAGSRGHLVSVALLIATAGCTPVQQAAIDAGLAQGEAGIKAAHDREALALKQAPCAMSVGGYVRALTSAEQGAVLTLCGGEQGLTFADLGNMGRAIQLLQQGPGASLADIPDKDVEW
jgi:hypothetical protein